MTSSAHDAFLSKVIINYTLWNIISKAELCVLVYISVYKTKHHIKTGFILIFDPENIGLVNFKSKLS